ncbi:MAG TPA: selenium-dependent xanthine dehydrogenase [Eubacteriales bacterium]|nr:selenium-dependent xanthine dehydrogenase [Eubacteriales bacterium]
MSTFTVNGKTVTVDKNQKLIVFLRDALRLTSVKNGCSEGACGTCMVLIDGKAMKSCVQQTDRLEGKSIITVEGLSPRERDVYAYAFAISGAVQCGFCTPGMVISAKGLIDKTPDPTLEQVKEALKNNICRCTGYKKIERAVLLAAKIFRENTNVPHGELPGTLGESIRRIEANGKTLGEAKYADDIYLEGMCLGSAVRSEYPRARVLSIDTSAAKEIEGVVGVFTSDDVPGEKVIGHLVQDYDVMIPVGGITRFLGDAIALVVAENAEALAAGKAAVKVEYEPLPAVFSPEESRKEGAPRVHEDRDNLLTREVLKRGDADAAIKNSAHVVTKHYSLPFTDHAFLEPECAVAEIEGDGVHVYSGDQGIYQTRKECAAMLGLPKEKVRVSAMMVGGGFGGKEDMSVQHHAALACFLTKRPVKVRFTRADSLLIHPKRHAMEMEFTTACDAEGNLTGMRARLIADTGAYASLGGPVLQRACTHAAGPYNYQNVDIEGYAYYTNNPPGGAFRGFGVTQSCFATECNLNLLAEMVGLTPFEFRYKNAIRPGQVLPNGQIADPTTALVETLDAVRYVFERDPKAGLACAMKNSGLGVGVPDFGRTRIAVSGGKLHLHSSAACIGQGMGTIQTQFVKEITGLPLEKIVYHTPDTALSPDAGNTTASRQTLFTGEATVRAAKLVKTAMDEAGSLEALEGREFYGEYEGVTDPLGSKKPNPVSHIAYGYATHVVELDDEGRVCQVTAAHDVGTAVNPLSLEGQIEGGVVMSLGYALTEDFPVVEGKPARRFGTLGLFKADKTPDVKAIIVGKATKDGLACGAKGIGEICSIPTAPAVQLAYYLRDGEFRIKLPLENTPYSKKK